MFMDEQMKRTIILENYQNPRNRGLTHNPSYERINTNSKSCIDEIDLEMNIKNGIIDDVKFDGEACAICTSSTSIMTELLIGKKIDEANKIIDSFQNMIEEKGYDKNIIGEAIVYCDISKQPNRKNCATLSWKAAKEIINSKR